NFGNFYLFKDKSIFNAYVSISPTLAPEMETRVPARLGALDQKIFYQLILEGEKTKDKAGILAMDKAIKALDKDNLYYNFTEYPLADHITVATYGIGPALDNIFAIFKPISPKEYKEEILASDDPPFKYLEDKYATIADLYGFKKPIELND